MTKLALPSAADVDAAARVLAPVAVRTRLITSPALDALTGGRIFLKPEVLQRTGSFKFRGAYNKLSSIPEAARKAGVVAFSSGNHAQGVAAAAQLLGMPAAIVMPSDAPVSKIERTKSYGAEVIPYDRDKEDRDAIARNGHATLHLDLVPGRTLERLRQDLEKPRNSRSLGEHLRRQTGIDGAKVALLHEVLDKPALHDTARIAATLKRLPLRLLRPRPMAETISTAGGVRLEAMDDALMLRDAPGVFCAGEMLDWEAPTGGYLLTACFASGLRAGRGAVAWLRDEKGSE